MTADEKFWLAAFVAIMVSTIVSTTHYVRADCAGEMLLSKKMDFIFLDAYKKSFDFYHNLKMKWPERRTLEDEWREKYNTSKWLHKYLEEHFMYALTLGKTSTSLSELFIALYVKFMAFLHGVNYLNCAIFSGNSEVLPPVPCKSIAYHLIWFSDLGINAIIKRIYVLMSAVVGLSELTLLPPIIAIENMISMMKKFKTEYGYLLYKTPKTLNDSGSADINLFFLSDRNAEFYQELTRLEKDIILHATSSMRNQFEIIKFSTVLPYSNYRFYGPPLPSTLDLAKVLWKKAPDLNGYYNQRHYITDIIRDLEIELLLACRKIDQVAANELKKNVKQFSLQLYFNINKKKGLLMIENHMTASSYSWDRFVKNINFRIDTMKDPFLHQLNMQNIINNFVRRSNL